MPRRRRLLALPLIAALALGAPSPAAAKKDAATRKAEKAFAKLVSENYGDPGPVVSCRRRTSTRWTCSFEAYTGGGQLCQGPGAGTVRRSGTRYRASITRAKVTCREE